MFSARAGSGVVIARLEDGCESCYASPQLTRSPLAAAWSAPSAIGTAGLGVGSQAGAEMTDFLVVLNSRAVSITLDATCVILTIAVGSGKSDFRTLPSPRHNVREE